MKSAYQVAKEIGISSTALYKRLDKVLSNQEDEFYNQLSNHVNVVLKPNGNKSYSLDEEAEKTVKEMYNSVVQPVLKPEEEVLEPNVEPVLEPENKRLLEQIEILQREKDHLQSKVDEKDLTIKDLTSQVLDISNRLITITDQQQKLLGGEMAKNNPALLAENPSRSEPAAAKKRSLFTRIFHPDKGQ